MLVASKAAFLKIIWRLALGFSMDLRLNTMRRSINLSVCLVFDLEAGHFKFLGENLLGAGVLENELSTLCLLLITCSKSQRKTHQIPQKFKAGF